MKTANKRNSEVARVAMIVGLAFGGIGFISTAKAVIITPGNTATPTGSGVFGGTVEDNVTTPFTGTGPLGVAFTGELETTVYSDPANSFGAGDLDFVYQFSNDNNSNNDAIENFSVNDFTGVGTNVDYVPGADVAPIQVSRLPAGTGDVVNYYFGTTGVPFDNDTDELVVQTNATTFQSGTASFQDGGIAKILAPVPSVPEPATAAIAAFALSALCIRRRKPPETKSPCTSA